MTREEALSLHVGDTIIYRSSYTVTGVVIEIRDNGFLAKWPSGAVELVRYDSKLLKFIEKKEG